MKRVDLIKAIERFGCELSNPADAGSDVESPEDSSA